MLYFYIAYTHSMEGILCVLEYYFLTIMFIIVLVSSLFVTIFLFGNLFSFFNSIYIYLSVFFFYSYLIFCVLTKTSCLTHLKAYFDWENKLGVFFRKKVEKHSKISMTFRKLQKIRDNMLRNYSIIPQSNIHFFFYSYSALAPFFFRNSLMFGYLFNFFKKYINFFFPIFYFSFSNKYYNFWKKNFIIALSYNFFRFLIFHNISPFWKSLISVFFTHYIFYNIPFFSFFSLTSTIFFSTLSLNYIKFQVFFITSSFFNNFLLSREKISIKFINKIFDKTCK